MVDQSDLNDQLTKGEQVKFSPYFSMVDGALGGGVGGGGGGQRRRAKLLQYLMNLRILHILICYD